MMTCRLCGKNKPASDFYFRKDRGRHRTACTECLSKQSVAHRDPVKRREANKRWAKKNPAKVYRYNRAWTKRNPDKMRSYWATRRARIRGQLYTCCSKRMRLVWYKAAALSGKEVDHIISLASGGLHCYDNFQLLTRSENARKGT